MGRLHLLFAWLHTASASELDIKLDYVSNTSKRIASAIETLFQDVEYSSQPRTCEACNTCAARLPSGRCDVSWGTTEGCSCEGRAIDTDHITIKASTQVSDADEIKNAVCYTSGIESTFKAMRDEDREHILKWMYYGSAEGVLVNYPGFLWGVSTDGSCSPEYDVTERDWYVMGATGPKDVVLVLDYSKSMKQGTRMPDARSAAKALVGSLTNIDYVSVVAFYGTGEHDRDCSEGDNGAYSPNTYLVPASSGYRDQLRAWIDTLSNPNGNPWGTCYTGAINKAFDIAQRSDLQGLTSNCSRVYVFMTDGEATDSFSDFEAIIQANKRHEDMFFIIGLGIDSSAESTNKAIACNIGGVYIRVEDNDPVGLRKAVSAYYQYLAMGAMTNEVQPTRFSEPYISIPNIWGQTVSAVTPVYDKRGTYWTMIGVAAVDVPLCMLAAAAESDGWTDDQVYDEYTPTEMGCGCLNTYTYDGQTFPGGCTSYAWSKLWCGTMDGCGICDDLVMPGGCWDNCDTAGTIEGKVKAYIKELSSTCFMTVQTEDALDVLRGSHKCSSEAVDDEWASMLETNNYLTCGSSCVWEMSGFEQVSYTDVYNEWCVEGSVFNPSACLACNSDMTPACAYEHCQASIEAGGVRVHDRCTRLNLGARGSALSLMVAILSMTMFAGALSVLY